MGIWDLFQKNLFKKIGGQKSFARLSVDYRDREVVKNKWQEIENLMTLGRPSNFKQAVLEADKLLDFVLKKMNYQGPALADRLRASKERFSDYQGIWEAHKIRNKLVHEVSSQVMDYQAKEAIEKFKKGFKNLGVL